MSEEQKEATEEPTNPAEKIAVVTACYNYGQFIPEWVAAIAAQERQPDLVVFVDNGSTDDTWAVWQREKKQLRCPVREGRLESRVNFGKARNEAVRIAVDAGVDWVSHTDVDDQLLPDALSQWEQKSSNVKTGVVAFGYRSLPQGVPQEPRTRLYEAGCGDRKLHSPIPASSPSPFRARLWRECPYNEELNGSWDTALWIGFARLGARFEATDRPAFIYRVHANSLWQSRPTVRKNNIGLHLQHLRVREHNTPLISVVIPFARPKGDETRKRVYQQVLAWVEEVFPCAQVVTEEHVEDGTFNKAEETNRLARKALGEVLIILDADVIPSEPAVVECLEALLLRRSRWAVPHQLVYRFNRESCEKFYPSVPVLEPNGTNLERRPYRGVAGGGCLILHRSTYQFIGGFDEEFNGWGGEDVAIGIVLQKLLGHPYRPDAPLIHLWHAPQETRDGTAHGALNKDRWDVYQKLDTVEQVAAFLGITDKPFPKPFRLREHTGASRQALVHLASLQPHTKATAKGNFTWGDWEQATSQLLGTYTIAAQGEQHWLISRES